MCEVSVEDLDKLSVSWRFCSVVWFIQANFICHFYYHRQYPCDLWLIVNVRGFSLVCSVSKWILSLTSSGPFLFLCPARKQEIIKMTEQLIEAINNGDFEAYTWVHICSFNFSVVKFLVLTFTHRDMWSAHMTSKGLTHIFILILLKIEKSCHHSSSSCLIL